MAYNKFSNDAFKPIHVRDTFLFLRGNVSGFATQGGETGTSELIGANSNPGASPDVPCVIGVYACHGAASQPGPIRSIDSEVLFNYGGVVTGSPLTTSVAAICGAINVASVTTLGAGVEGPFTYGVQGKAVIQGTMNIGSGFCSGLFAQLDTSGASAAITSGYVAPLIIDFGATSNLASSAYLNGQVVLNTTNCIINAAVKVVANASYLFDVTDLSYGGSHFYVHSGSGLGSIGTDYLVVLVNGVAKHIPLYA